jgi:hypothetical protein
VDWAGVAGGVVPDGETGEHGWGVSLGWAEVQV